MKKQTVSCKIEHHAVLFALLAKYAIQECGDEGREAILAGMTAYGNERGMRMAQNALAHGDELTTMTNQAYGEWQPDYEGQMEFGQIRTEPTLQTYISKCAWCDAWKKHNLMEYGKLYCVNVDNAVYQGFRSDFTCTHLSPAMSWGGDQCKFDWGGVGVLDIIDIMADLYPYAGPGHWNDAEMLEIGNGGMTKDEYITHFSMWCMLATPLMAGNDLRKMDAETKEILTNKEVISVNQDKLGQQARRFMDMGEKEIWAKPLANGELAVCFLNRTETTWHLNYDWHKQTIYFADQVNIHKKEYTIRDLWKHQNIGTTQANTVCDIPPHGVLMVRLSEK